MMPQVSTLPPAGLIRRLGALLYDAFIITILELVAAGIAVVAIELMVFIGIFQWGHYLNIDGVLTHHPVISPLFTAYLAFIWITFFVWSWSKKGQTIGMKAWKLVIKNKTGGPITITQALIRLFTSGFGLANLTIPYDIQKRGFHDIWANTQMYVDHSTTKAKE